MRFRFKKNMIQRERTLRLRQIRIQIRCSRTGKTGWLTTRVKLAMKEMRKTFLKKEHS